MKKWMWAGGGLVILGGLLLAGRSCRQDTPSDKKETRRIFVEQGPLETTIEATGDVSPLNRVEIQPPVSGRVEKLLVDEGAFVHRGQILGWISSTDRTAIMDAARAQGPEALARWADTYKPTPLVSPLSGTVILRKVVVGQTVNTGTVLYAISDELIVIAKVDEVDIGRIQPNMPVRIVLDAYPNQPVEGSVFNILREGKNISNVITYDVKIKPHPVPDTFRSEMTANVSFILERKDNALQLPLTAISTNADGEKKVLVPGPDGKVLEKTITTGMETADKVEILSGLKVGDPVLGTTGRYVPQTASPGSPLVSTGPSRTRSTGGGRSRGAH